MTKAKTPTLDAVRARIDAVDEELLKLIDERASLAAEVAKAKRADAAPAVFGLRPARETQVLRRLLALPRESADRALVVKIWRELMSDSLARQGPFHVAVWSSRNPARAVELARLRLGASPYLRMVDEPEQAFAAAKTLGGVAVLSLSPNLAWWAKLLVEPKLSVFAVLPCLSQWGSPEALAVAQVAMEPSGADDETLWLTDSKQQSWQIEIDLSRDGIAAKLLTEAGGLKLFALSGFFQRNDERLARAPGRLTGVIGVVPASFDY